MKIFQSKQKKIENYLNKRKNEMTAFDLLLEDYLSGKLKDKLSEYGISRTEIHIDWLDDYKCIGIQGMYNDYCIDLRIEEKTFSIAFDKDEPDDFSEYPLTNQEAFYRSLGNLIRNIPL